MIGDKLVITDYHRKAAAQVLPHVRQKLEDRVEALAVSIAGESGSGKSEIAACLAELLEEEGLSCLVLCQDDYFRLPPKSNHQKRKKDISWVGPGEVRLDLMDAHVCALKDYPEKPLCKPLVIFKDDATTCEIIEPGVRQVTIVEGTYTSLIDSIDIRVFLDRDYRQTRGARKRRARDPVDEFLEHVLAIEHEEISSHKGRADIIIDGPEDDNVGR